MGTKILCGVLLFCFAQATFSLNIPVAKVFGDDYCVSKHLENLDDIHQRAKNAAEDCVKTIDSDKDEIVKSIFKVESVSQKVMARFNSMVKDYKNISDCVDEKMKSFSQLLFVISSNYIQCTVDLLERK